MEEAPRPLPLAVLLEGGPAGWSLNGVGVADQRQLLELLLEEADRSRSLVELAGDLPFDGRYLLAVDASLPTSQVLEVIDTATSAGFGRLVLVAESNEVPDIGPAPRPAYAEGLKASLAATPADGKQRLLAEEIDGLVGFCPPVKRLFKAVAAAPAELKCSLLWSEQGLPAAMKRCPGLPTGKLVTVFHVMSVPQRGYVGWELLVDPEAEPLLLDAEAPWADTLVELRALEGGSVWPLVEGALEASEVPDEEAPEAPE